MHIGCWCENLRERNHLENQDVVGRIILKCIVKKQDGEAWTGFIGIRIGTDGGLL